MKENETISYRQDILKYAAEQYGTEPEFLWASYPEYAVLRHRTGKWYAVIMDVPREKLGLPGSERVDILDVKCEADMIGSFRQRKGFLPAYHMNKSRWLTILLDGSVDKETIFFLLDMSYDLIEKEAERKGRAKRSGR